VEERTHLVDGRAWCLSGHDGVTVQVTWPGAR